MGISIKNTLVVVLLAGFFAVSLTGSAQSAPIKAGAACAKVGKSVVVKKSTYKCVAKKGAKVWKKVKVQKPLTPVEQMLAAPLPVPNPNSGYQVANEIDAPAMIEALFNEIMPSEYTLPPLVEIHKDPNVRAEWSSDLEQGVARAFALNSVLGVGPTKAIDVYIGKNYAFLGPVLKSSWCAGITGDADPMFGGGGDCGDGVLFARTDFWENSIGGQVYPYPTMHFDLWLNSVLPHEIAHNGQYEKMERNIHPEWLSIPTWLNEGWPEIVKIAIWGEERGMTYRQAREHYFDLIRQNCADASLTDLRYPRSDERYCEYDYGMIATEFLLASFQTLEAALWMHTEGQGVSLETDFKAVYGIEFEKFRLDAEKYVAAQYEMHL